MVLCGTHAVLIFWRERFNTVWGNVWISVALICFTSYGLGSAAAFELRSAIDTALAAHVFDIVSNSHGAVHSEFVLWEGPHLLRLSYSNLGIWQRKVSSPTVGTNLKPMWLAKTWRSPGFPHASKDQCLSKSLLFTIGRGERKDIF